MISDSWFIGFFGKWWRGGVIEAWYQDVVARSKDEESWSSGIIAAKALDKFNECNGEFFFFVSCHFQSLNPTLYRPGLPFSTKNSLAFGPPRGSPPRLRNRERPSHRLSGLPSRSSTPPPLPKSASLPLHTTRLPHSIPDHPPAQVDRIPSQSPPSLPTTSDPLRSGTPTPPSNALFDQSPLIAEVLRQISISNSTVYDLREQLADFQSSASQSHSLLQTEVDSYRDRKRQEDASRLELKSRTKTLEDSKRSAESAKVKVEKRLKAAQSARDDTVQQTARLDQQITELHRRLADDEIAARQAKDDASKVEHETSDALERRKQEIKVTEDVLAALNARARELEEKLASEKERLRLAKVQADIRKQDQSFHPFHTSNNDTGPWPSLPFDYPILADAHPSSETDIRSRKSSIIREQQPVSPRPAKLSLRGISNFSATGSSDIALRAKGYSIFDDDIASLTKTQQVTTTFSPFSENDSLAQPPSELPTLLSPPLIPTRNGSSRSFQSESDPYMDRDWRGTRVLHNQTALSVSPISDALSTTTAVANDYDPFELRIPKHDRFHSEPVLDLQRFTMLHRTHSDPHPNGDNDDEAFVESVNVNMDNNKTTGPRRWFSSSSKVKPKKGLNPDAKVFRLPKKSTSNVPVATPNTTTLTPNGGDGSLPFDVLNPNGPIGGCCNTISTASSSFLHAFAPSPAEREVLKRALGGGSTNTSLERLPSLSDVGHSIPSSPSDGGRKEEGKFGSQLPSWLLPRIRKPNFSPWDDDEVASAQQQQPERPT